MAPVSEVHRLFFALWPDATVRASIAAAAELLKQHHHPHGRWLKPHRYHLTLQFLGDFSAMPHELATRACDAATKIQAGAFALALDRAGSFRNRAMVWWLGCAQIPDELASLWQALGAAMRTAHIAFDTKLRLTPHVTVLRDADVALPLTPIPSAQIPSITWHVDEFVLIHSRLGAQSQYRVLGRWPLRQCD
jgi:2'-5' RNA ligase